VIFFGLPNERKYSYCDQCDCGSFEQFKETHREVAGGTDNTTLYKTTYSDGSKKYSREGTEITRYRVTYSCDKCGTSFTQIETKKRRVG
jgi:protein-arginine kinase activator protein McsA